MMIIKLFILRLCLSVAQQGIVEAISVTEVSAGHLAELPCLSSDDVHRFMFWQLHNGKDTIGPSNLLDPEKYNYEVLTGKLLIREVSTLESGIYRCFSRGIEDNSDFKVHEVELIVKKDWIEENSLETNLLRGMTITMVIVVGIAIALIIVMIRKRNNHRLFDVIEESRENSPARYVGNVQSAPVTPTPRTVESGGLDNMGLDVDFPKVFSQMQREQPL